MLYLPMYDKHMGAGSQEPRQSKFLQAGPRIRYLLSVAANGKALHNGGCGLALTSDCKVLLRSKYFSGISVTPTVHSMATRQSSRMVMCESPLIHLLLAMVRSDRCCTTYRLDQHPLEGSCCYTSPTSAASKARISRSSGL